MDSCSLKPKRKYNKRRPLIDEPPKTISKDEYSKFKLPMFFENRKNCNGHLRVQKCYLFGAKRISTIPPTPEKYHSKFIHKNIKVLFSF